MKEDGDILASVREHVRAERADDASHERAAVEEVDEAAIDRVVAHVEKVREPSEGGPPRGDRARKKDAPKAPAPVVPLHGAPRSVVASRIAKLAVSLALAACLVLYVTVGRRAGSEGPDLPGYGVTASGEAQMRGAPQSTTRLHLPRGSAARFEIVARPDSAAATKVVAYAFTVQPGEREPQPLDAEVQVSPDGAVRIRGAGRALQGASEVRVVIGSVEAIGNFEGALVRAKASTSDAKVRVLSVAIDRE